jgi:hypothetical protein
MDAAAFAASSANYYGMTYIGAFCADSALIQC